MVHTLQKLNGIFWILIFIVIFPILAEEEGTALDEVSNPVLRIIKIGIGTLLHETTKTRKHKELLVKTHRAAKPLPNTTHFPCDLKKVKLRSDKIPTSAHDVRPGDIDVVGAMGDSLTAGTGISTSLFVQELFSEERGRSWSIGGEGTWKTYLTLPNIIKEFNPKLFGFALGFSQSFQLESQFNVAENGAISKNMPFMVRELVKRITEDSRVDLKRHWKMVTLMIGDNDFCSEMCFYPNPYDVLKKHRRDLLYVLRYLRDNLPRTIVNIVPPPRLNLFYNLKNPPSACYLMHNFACPCIGGLAYRNKRQIFDAIMIKWQQVDIEVSNMLEFDLDEFTVILHNFTVNYTFPTTPDGALDYGYLAPDCFHFSERAQARFANDLWNSLLEPFGTKHTDGTDVFSNFHCPSEEHPYIFSRRNSR